MIITGLKWHSIAPKKPQIGNNMYHILLREFWKKVTWRIVAIELSDQRWHAIFSLLDVAKKITVMQKIRDWHRETWFDYCKYMVLLFPSDSSDISSTISLNQWIVSKGENILKYTYYL